jgi:hypothetical protein
LVQAAIPADPDLPEAWPTCAVLLPHLRTVLDLSSEGMWRIADCLGHSVSYPAARDLWRQITGALRNTRCWPEHQDTVSQRLADWAGRDGDPAGARDQFATLLPRYEQILGSQHPHTLITDHSIAYWARRYTSRQGLTHAWRGPAEDAA